MNDSIEETVGAQIIPNIGARGPRGTERQKGKLTHKILRAVGSVEGLTAATAATHIDENYWAVRNELTILRGAGLLKKRTRYLILTPAGERVVENLGNGRNHG
jgi:hypothetical protein